MKPGPKPLSSQGSGILLWVVAVAFFMQMLDATILNTALPGMAVELHVAPLRMQSVVIAYILTTALVIPASAWLAERFGVKRIFVFAIFLFTLGSLLCALSPNLGFMVAFRIVQGVGGALMVPVGRYAAIRAFPRRELVRVLSFITIPGLVGPLVGPVAGGFLVQYASWHWIFLINLPVGVVGGVLAWRFMSDEAERKRPDPFDWSGFLFFSAAMVLISMGMEGLGELRLPKVQATLLCIAGTCLLGIYWVRAAQKEHPLFSPSLLRLRSFSVGILGNLFSRLGSGAMPFLMPLFLQLVLGFSPFLSGMTMIPSALASMMGKSVVTPLVRRFGFRTLLTVNTLALGAMIASFALVTTHTPYILLLCQLAVFGIINSLQFTVMNSVTLVDLSDEQTNDGNGLLSVTMQISNCCGVAMAAALVDGFMANYGASPTPAQLAGVFEQTFIWVGVLSIVTGVIFSHIPPDSGRRAREEPPPSARIEIKKSG